MENKGIYKTPNVFSSPIETPLLVMNIDIGNGVCEQLILYKNQNIAELALNFCNRFNLDENLAEILKTNIESNLNGNNDQGDQSLNEEKDGYSRENSEFLASKHEKKPSLSEIYNNQKVNHSENMFLDSHLSETNKIFSESFQSHPRINSEKIEEKQRKIPVFQRLFSAPKGKKSIEPETNIKEKVNITEMANKVQNVTNRLYKLSLRESTIKKQKAEDLKLQANENNLKECTYHPKINLISSIIMQNKKLNKSESIENSLLCRGRDSVLNKDLKRYAILKKEIDQCTFQPKITETKNSRERSKENIFFKLHEDSNKKKIYIADYKSPLPKENPFQSENKIYRNSATIVENSFLKRQQIFEMKKKAKADFLANRDLNIDQSTGEKLFHPKILNSQNKDSSHDPSQIFKELYEQKHKKEIIVKNLMEKENFMMMQKSYKPLEISNKIVLIKRKLAIEALFDLFDGDHDGEISSEKIDISQVDSKKLMVMAPFLCFIEKNNLNLKLEDFFNHMEHFMKGLTYQEIHNLFD